MQSITKFLKEQLQKIIEHYQGSTVPHQTSFLTAGQTNAVDIDQALKYWNYCCALAKQLYDVSSANILKEQEAVARIGHNNLKCCLLTALLIYSHVTIP